MIEINKQQTNKKQGWQMEHRSLQKMLSHARYLITKFLLGAYVSELEHTVIQFLYE